MENWIEIKNWEDRYEVSDLGRVRSKDRLGNNYRSPSGKCIKKGKIRKLNFSKGYLYVLLYRSDTDMIKIGVHVLVARSFLKNPLNKPTVNHLNGIKTDNNKDNLEWATHQEQQLHAVKLGLRNNTVGENSNFSKLSKNEILKIREEYSKGGVSMRSLSKKYNTVATNISWIVKNKTWKHI